MAEGIFRTKVDIVFFSGAVLSIIGVIHFLIAVVIWIFSFKGFVTSESNISWPMFLHFIQALLLLSAFILAFVMFVKKVRLGGIVIILGVFLSVIFFIIDIKNRNFQLQRPIQHIGSRYSEVTIAYKYDYYNWWWYNDIEVLEEELEK